MANNRVLTTWSDGDADVTLYRCEDGSYSVAYGKQVTTGLDYAAAATDFGKCVFHSLACVGKLDDEQ